MKHLYINCRGWEQLEVTCNPRQIDKNNIWNIEGNENDQCKTLVYNIKMYLFSCYCLYKMRFYPASQSGSNARVDAVIDKVLFCLLRYSDEI